MTIMMLSLLSKIKEITIYDNRRIILMLQSVPSVFRLNSRPWINPDSARAEEIIDTMSLPFLFFCWI
jgi:uncharacterized Fe-S cluster protein YjdI